MTLEVTQGAVFWPAVVLHYLALATVMGRWACRCNGGEMGPGVFGFVFAPLTLIVWAVSVGQRAPKPPKGRANDDA